MTDNVMYLGPSVRGVARYGAIYKGGIPKALSKLAAAKPVVNNLIVPVANIPTAASNLQKEGTVESVSYGKVAALTRAEISEILTKGE